MITLFFNVILFFAIRWYRSSSFSGS